MIEATPPIGIKGVGNQIRVAIIPATPFELIQAGLARLVEPLKHLARAARIVLGTGAGQASAVIRRQIGHEQKNEVKRAR
jgi:hypothetical protein